MGQIKEKVMIKNFGDILDLKKGVITEDKIRYVEVEAVVDTGAALLCLPPDIITNLGFVETGIKKVTTANGRVERRIFSIADITIKDRTIQAQVMENDRTTPPLIGYLVLEAMDYVADPKSQQLIGNPAHNGQWIIDLY